MREEWRVVDRWWTDEPVDRRYFDLVLETRRERRRLPGRRDEVVVHAARLVPHAAPQGRRTTVCVPVRATERASIARRATLTSNAACRDSVPAADKLSGVARARTSSCTRTRRTRSSTAPRSPRSSPPGRPSSATRRSRSPTTTASTARSSSRRPRSTSACGRSPAPRSRSRAERTSRSSREPRRATRTSAGILTDAHAGTRPRAGARAAAAGARHRASSRSCTRGSSASPAARGTGSPCVDPNAAARLARVVRPRPLLRRAAAPVRARRRAPQRRARATSPRRSACATVATGDVHAHDAAPRRAPGRARRDPRRTSLDGCERERRGNHESRARRAGRACSSRFPHDRDAVTRTRRARRAAARST